MKRLTITDLEGKEIEITDLNLAIMQADDFRHYSTTIADHLPFVSKRQCYWEDFYQKLLALQAQNH